MQIHSTLAYMNSKPHAIRKASTAIIHDTRSMKKDNSYPVKLRVTYERKQKYYPTGKDLTIEEYEKVFAEKPRKEHKTIKLYLQSIEHKAEEVIKNLNQFSFDEFEKKFLAKKTDERSVFAAYQRTIDKLYNEGRAGNADALECSMESIKKYVKKPSLTFDAVTVDFLKGYEKYMLDQGKSATTVGIYLRALRALFNEAIENGVIALDAYPFGKRRYQIPSGRNIKKALTLPEIGKIFHYQASEHTKEAWAKDMWVFSYLCSGINVKDIARLRYKDISGEHIHFIRSKTAHTTRSSLKPITVLLSDEAKAIIEKWGIKPAKPDGYVFDILKGGETAKRELALVRQATKNINTHIQKIALAVGIDKKVSTYFARHSFATVLKRSGASIAFISEALGHSNMKTTQAYLDAFSDETKKEFTKALTSFNQE